MTTKKIIGITVLALVIGLVIGYVAIPKVSRLAGAGDCSSNTCLTSLVVSGLFEADGAISALSTFTLGTSGTSFSRMNGGTCYIRPYAATISATSTVKVDCQGTAAWNASGMSALTGVTTNDNVQVRLATSTAGTTSGGINITGASASTTPGFIELYINNLTGTTFTWPTSGTASGTASYFVTK